MRLKDIFKEDYLKDNIYLKVLQADERKENGLDVDLQFRIKVKGSRDIVVNTENYQDYKIPEYILASTMKCSVTVSDTISYIKEEIVSEDFPHRFFQNIEEMFGWMNTTYVVTGKGNCDGKIALLESDCFIKLCEICNVDKLVLIPFSKGLLIGREELFGENTDAVLEEYYQNEPQTLGGFSHRYFYDLSSNKVYY